MRNFSVFIAMFGNALCNGFVFNPSVNIQRTRRPTIAMIDHPSEIIKRVSRGGLGDEWTYNDFVTNLQNHNVDAATLTNNDNII
tara:strand:+ start:1728 stop:1979 length:252 start_codon:yes stop_codon:yes gene_type:complete